MTLMLLVTASALGLLAFFEPCTIATNTLFSAHANRANRADCCQRLLAVWLTRSALLVALLVLSVWTTNAPAWGPFLPSVILTALAVVYIVSRFTYVPVPHLEFFRLLPGGARLPFAIKLGLTLPACTLPLVIVVIGMAITADSAALAALAGLLFASLFTLPTAIASFTGVDDDARELLNRAGKGSPYLTAVLLVGAALYLLIPSLNINSDTLKAALTQASWVGIGIAFLTGFVFSFNPVSFASIPVMLAYVTRAHEERRAVMMGGAFVAGMLVTHAVLGVAAALGGSWVQGVMGREWGLFLGPLLIVMGLMWSGLLNIRLPWFGVKGRPVTGVWGAFLLGIPFSVAVCPFCTPALLVTLTASAAIGSVPFGLALLLAFAAGRSIPVMLGAWSMGWLDSLHMLTRHQKTLEIVAGMTLAATGLYLLNEYFFFVEY